MHVFYELTPLGVLAGIAEAALFGFAMATATAWTYNRMAKRT